MTTPQTIWTNAHFPDDATSMLHSGVTLHRLVVATETSKVNLVGAPPDPKLEEAEIAFGQPDAEQLMRLEKIRWVHLTSAGYTNYDRDDLKKVFRERGIALTTSSGVYDEPCAEHLFAMIMGMSRQLPMAFREQLGGHGWPSAEVRVRSQLLKGKRAILFGYGEIAKRLSELLAPFHMELVGVRRSPKGDESIPVITLEEADAWLPKADHVINILPANPDSNGYFGKDRLGLLKPSALFYNIGRGTTVDQTALLDALNEERIAGAYLDVTIPEPLPADHPLWTARNCWITPHSAGGFQEEMVGLVSHFLSNLALYQAGKPLRNRVI